MISISSTEFSKNFGRYKEAAQREPIAITSHGRTSGYFVSAQEYNDFQQFKSYYRKSYSVHELPHDIALAIEKTSMNSAHQHLNHLLND